jgi:hypothetical protein
VGSKLDLAAPGSQLSPLTPGEQQQLAELEATIGRGLVTFVSVGEALARVRDGRLYREDHPTFESYCEARWGFQASRARQLIAAANVATSLESVTDVTPANEAQARALVPIAGDPRKLTEVWGRVSRNGPPTPEAIRVAVRESRSPSASTPLSELERLRGNLAEAKAALEKAQARYDRARRALADYTAGQEFIEW